MADLQPADWEIQDDTPPTEEEVAILAAGEQLKKERLRVALEDRLVVAKAAVEDLEGQIADLCEECDDDCACGHGGDVPEVKGSLTVKTLDPADQVVLNEVVEAVVEAATEQEDEQRLAKDVVADIEKVKTAEAVETLAKDDDRATVRKAAEKRLDELKPSS